MSLLVTRRTATTDLDAHNQHLTVRLQQSHPKKTTEAYRGKQQEWIRFCRDNRFDDDLVTEKKPVPRYKRRYTGRNSSYRRACADSSGNTITQKLGYSSLKTYTAAMIDLWRF